MGEICGNSLFLSEPCMRESPEEVTEEGKPQSGVWGRKERKEKNKNQSVTTGKEGNEGKAWGVW